MRKMSLRLLCEAVSKKRKGVYGTIRIGAVLPTTHGTHGATWLWFQQDLYGIEAA